ncbi:testis anion transporter 1 isoform X2 [Monodelphis domestica]|uniref:testis anion transporter 1 isoform X2 n=1 Tax=Monodelphis domestica TaxID=13616 RepID=UPI000443382C|nr:testis anion transporter 1 isoform X2 [Monodelphis domestica]
MSLNTKQKTGGRYVYDVKREVYNEESFQKEHRRKGPSSGNVDINITTIKHRVQCRCSWKRFKNIAFGIFPILEWMYVYRFKDWLLGDLLAGLNVGLVQVPQVSSTGCHELITSGSIVEGTKNLNNVHWRHNSQQQCLILAVLIRMLIPPLNISYASFCCSLIYIIFGTSHHMSIGNFFLVSALTVNVLKRILFNSGHLLMGTFVRGDFEDPAYSVDYERALAIMQAVTFLTGLIQLLIGVLRLDFFTKYLPDTLINAYLAATALHVMMSQLCFIFGIMNLVNYCIALPRANSTSILLFLICMVALRVNKCIKISFKRYPIEFPMEFVLIVCFTIIANKIHMNTETSKNIVEMIPYSFLYPEPVELGLLHYVVCHALSLSIVSYVLLLFTGKKLASLHNYNINPNQELVAIGLCNLISSFFKCFVFTSDIARTVIQEKSGGRQQFAALIGAGITLLVMLKMGHYFFALPNAVLAGIVLSNVLPFLATVMDLPDLWKQNQHDFVIWIVTFLSVLCLGLDIGLLISVVFTFFITTVQSHRATVLVLGQIPNTNIYRSFADYREAVYIPGVKIFQFCTAITFVNVEEIKQALLKEVDLKTVPLSDEDLRLLFSENRSEIDENIFKCSCNCDEPEPPPRIAYTEHLENKSESDSSSIDMFDCSPFEVPNTSRSMSEEQMAYMMSHSNLRHLISKEEIEKIWDPSHSTINSSGAQLLMPSPSNIEHGEIPFRNKHDPGKLNSDVSFISTIHTIILDFTMVNFVDVKAIQVIRQICNAFYNIDVLVLLAGCHPMIVKTFERNDFFDTGITKAQLFLSLHDAVLFALGKKFLETTDDEQDYIMKGTLNSLPSSQILESESKRNLFSASPKGKSRRTEQSREGSPSPKKKQFSPGLYQDDTQLESKELDERVLLETQMDPDFEVHLDLGPDLDFNLHQETETDPEFEIETRHAINVSDSDSECQGDDQLYSIPQQRPYFFDNRDTQNRDFHDIWSQDWKYLNKS